MKKVISFIITIAVIIAIRFAGAWLIAERCETCNKKITDTEYHVGNKIYCNTCKPAGYIYR